MFQFLRRLPLFWRLHCAGWLLLAISMLPVRLVISRQPNNLFGALHTDLSFFLFRDVLGFVGCIGLRWLYQRHYFQRLRPLMLGLHLVILAAFMSALDVGSAQLIFRVIDRTQANLTVPVFLAAAFWLHVFIFSIWSFLYFFIKAFLKAKKNERRLAQAAARQREMELLMLRAHLEPHFIFNALNAITILSHGNPGVIPVVRGLSDYLRFCLANREKTFVPLGEELDAIGQYLKVEQARFGDELMVRMDVDDASSRHIPVPGVFMMPLVENALKHRAPGNHPLYLWIQIEHRHAPDDLAVLEELRRRPFLAETHAPQTRLLEPDFTADAVVGGADQELLIRVTSNSTWHDPVTRNPDSPASGVGLSNLCRRLELLYPGPDRAGFSIGPRDGYVVAEIRIQDPLRAFRGGMGKSDTTTTPASAIQAFRGLFGAEAL